MSWPGATVVDTDVFSRVYVNPVAADSRAQEWRDVLAGRPTVISFQTRGEVLSGARQANWGASRMARLLEVLQRTPTIYADVDVVGAYAKLSAECRAGGHPLHDKIHTADRWIAARAIAKQFELLSGDAIFQGAPNLNVIN